jgi:hypothetical protein
MGMENMKNTKTNHSDAIDMPLNVFIDISTKVFWKENISPQ